MRNKKKLS